MGDAAEMLLEGMLCEGCGEFFDYSFEEKGHPDYCSPQCAIDRGATWWLIGHGYKQQKDGRWVKGRNRGSKYG
jgi:hypothetical protein